MAALVLLAIGLPWIGAACARMIGDRRPRAVEAVAVAFGIAAIVPALLLLPRATTAPALRLPAGGVFGAFAFVPDGLGAFLTAIAAVIGCLAVVFSVEYMRGEPQRGRYYALVLLFIGSMAGLALAGSLLLLFFFWELVAFCSYALISFRSDDPKAVAGGVKALLVTGLGGVGLLAASLTALAYLGTDEIAALLARAGEVPPATLSVIAFGVLAGAAAKSAQVPFHTWLPDAMEAPTPVSALIHAATMVNAGVYVLARFAPAFAAVPGWSAAVIAVGVASALLAAAMAAAATDLKRVLAYSTISQLGVMVYAVGLGAAFAAQFHLLSHAVFKALLFLAAGAVTHAVGTRDLREMGGLGRRMPFVRDAFVIGALALAGLPVLNGFWSKEMILEAGWARGPAWAAGLMLAAAGLTALYAFRAVSLAFFGDGPGRGHDAGPMMRLALWPLAAGALTTWLLAGPLGRLLAVTFPRLPAASTGEIVREVATAPATAAALGAVALGLTAWAQRARVRRAAGGLEPLAHAAADGFGFEWVNARAVASVRAAAAVLARTQTGQVNWNVAGIVGALAAVTALLAWGGPR